jgi:uncharacterized protein YprB with RNaseH-like and TPR domain
MEIDHKFLNKFKDFSDKQKEKKQSRELPGEVISRNNVKFLITTNSREFKGFGLPERDIFNNAYNKTLELLYGIRDKKAEKILACGIKDLKDAVRHDRFREEAGFILSALDKDIHAVKEVLSSRFSPSHRLYYLLLSFFRPEELLFVDIETKSLFFETSIIEIGAGYFEGSKFTVKQFTCLTDAAEYEVLEEFGKLLPGKKAFVTYNGRSFDIPFIDGRISYHGNTGYANDILELHNFDLLHFSRCCYKREFDSYRLKAMEAQVLGKEREGDIDGSEIQVYFENYVRTLDPKYIEPIIYHNREDIYALVMLMERLTERWIV